MKPYFHGYFNYFYCYFLWCTFNLVNRFSLFTERIIAIPVGIAMLVMQICVRLLSTLEAIFWGLKESFLCFLSGGVGFVILLSKYREVIEEMGGLMISPITSLFASIAMTSSMIINPKATCSQFISACERRLKFQYRNKK
jgi:hypothetical protein